jgi:dipeptidyl aminopeptidase/acylaminoacyl peptidase
MQEDVEDAVAWTVKQGYADADRVCISGSSYGGYATLMGVAKTPNLYKCGVAGFAVADLEMLITSPAGDIPYNKAGLAFWKVMVGDPAIETDVTAMRAVSPTYLADRIKAPIYLVSGADDYRVPLEHAQKMRAALRKAGKEPKWMVKENEAHGFGKVQNRVEMYNSVMGFFDEHIGKAKE